MNKCCYLKINDSGPEKSIPLAAGPFDLIKVKKSKITLFYVTLVKAGITVSVMETNT